MKSSIFLVFLFLLLVLPVIVVAEEDTGTVTIHVDSKEVVGMGTGHTPFNDNVYCNVVYVLVEREMNGGYDKYVRQEYPVCMDDYCRVGIGDTVTLKKPQYRTDVWTVVEIT